MYTAEILINTNWSGNLLSISRWFPPQLTFWVLLEGLGAFASRRRCFQLCLQDHLNFNLICFQKRDQFLPAGLFCPNLCPCWWLHLSRGAGRISLREKWGCKNGREIRGGRWCWEGSGCESWGAKCHPREGTMASPGRDGPGELQPLEHPQGLRAAALKCSNLSEAQVLLQSSDWTLHPWLLCPNVPQQLPCALPGQAAPQGSLT